MVHLVSVMLLVLVVMLIMLIMWIVLVVTNIISHVHTLASCGNHSTCVGVVFNPMVGASVLTYSLEVV